MLWFEKYILPWIWSAIGVLAICVIVELITSPTGFLLQ
jgi:hypothetical protein